MNETAKQLYPVYCTFLKNICEIETPSSDKQALDRMAGEIRMFAENRGFCVERIPFPKAGDCLRITNRADSFEQEAPFLLMAHMDTVHPVGAFGEHPLQEEGGIWHGPGVIDCKGGIAVALMAMELLTREGFSKRPLVLLLTADEEISSELSGPEGIDLIKNEAKKAYAVLNCETGKAGALTVGRKGIAKLRLGVSGKAAHAGNAYFDGVSAVVEAARQIVRITELSRREGATFNCGIVQGGTAVNVVPDYCEVMIDIRDTTITGLEQAVEAVRQIAKTPETEGAKVTLEQISARPPMEHTAGNDRLLEGMNRAAEACGYPPFSAVVKGGGSDSAYTVQVGAPTICSCGLEGYGEHTLDERAEIKTLMSRARILAEAMKNHL